MVFQRLIGQRELAPVPAVDYGKYVHVTMITLNHASPSLKEEVCQVSTSGYVMKWCKGKYYFRNFEGDLFILLLLIQNYYTEENRKKCLSLIWKKYILDRGRVGGYTHICIVLKLESMNNKSDVLCVLTQTLDNMRIDFW